MGAGFYQQAEVHRLCGDYAAAEEFYREASQSGFEPQPGLSLLRLAQGNEDVARGSIRRILGAPGDLNSEQRTAMLQHLDRRLAERTKGRAVAMAAYSFTLLYSQWQGRRSFGAPEELLASGLASPSSESRPSER